MQVTARPYLEIAVAVSLEGEACRKPKEILPFGGCLDNCSGFGSSVLEEIDGSH